ncbi:MAG TPA: efflux RND transporter periplasmic adaptor subunit [Flavitalea sp.]|nr:efflux RND transporter periplasmic adaptor subunit [Flavitalea sp.]
MKFLLFLSSILAITISITGCRADAKTENTNARPAIIPVVKLQAKDTTVQQEYVADIQAVRNVEIRSKISGFIDKILVDEGQEVKKGQLLFTIANAENKTACTQAMAFLSNAEAEAKAAELDLSRVKTLVDKRVISQTEYELAKARLKAAEAKVEEARSLNEKAHIRLAYANIRAPFSGVIDRIPQKLGSLVDEGTLLTNISDISEMYAYFTVSENEYLRYQRVKGTKEASAYDQIRLRLADDSEFPHTGRVETMESQFNRQTGSIAFRATFPNPEKILKHGASGKIAITSSLTNALILPQKSVMEIQDRSFVFTVDKDNKVSMKSFTPKTTINEFIVVQSGLAEDDIIVFEGIQNIRDGSYITPEYITLDSVPYFSYKH